jgi:hypothetical protein
MIYQLLYASAATGQTTQADVDEILAASTRNNRANGITGMLLVMEDAFIQALEGEKEVVEQTFARIARDARHRQIHRIFETMTAQRAFPGWSMGYERIAPSDPAGEVFRITGDVVRDGLPSVDSREIQIMVRNFFRICGADRRVA